MIAGLLSVASLGLLIGMAGAWPVGLKITGRRAVATPLARVWLLGTLFGLSAAFAAAVWVLSTGVTWEWSGTFLVGRQAPHLRLDGISAFFLALLSVVGAAGTVYSHEYWPESAHPRSARSGRGWWNVLLLCLGLVLVSSNGLHFLIGWELFTVSAYCLITREQHRAEVRKAGYLYLGASHAGTLCLFAFFAALAAKTGSWDLGPMQERAGMKPLFWLALGGFGLKAGLFPLHIWLPSAHASAPSHVSAILSGVAIKMGIYGLVRFSGWLPMPDGAGWVVAGLGVVSAVLGVAFALGQHDLKRLLAYHSVENIGIILIGLGFAMAAVAQGDSGWGMFALAGGLLHVWNHGIFKALLFLGAGSVLHATGTREMSRLGGLWRTMPWTATLFSLGAAAISGLPPLNGFVSEWLIYLGLFEVVGARAPASWAAVPAGVFLAMTGALALACFVKAVGIVFLGVPRTREAETARESGRFMLGPMVVLAALCVLIGVAPALFWPALHHAIEIWRPGWAGQGMPASLVTLGMCNAMFVLVGAMGTVVVFRRVRRNGISRAVTWDCGYAAPSARMQYTAGSFAGIITGWFAWILRPERQAKPALGLFPGAASREEHTPETVLEQVVEPAGAILMRASSAVRQLQHGRLQAYILYLLLGLAALALVVFVGGGR